MTISPEYKGFQRRDRTDGISGYEEVIFTKMGFVEKDRSDVRMNRIRAYDVNDRLEKTYLEDPMGVPFKDMPDVLDEENS